MNKVKVTIWGREFELDVIFQNYPGEIVDDMQKKTLEDITSTDFDKSKKEVEQYIRKYFSFELGEDSLDNIFRYVIPKRILIPKSDESSIFAVMCNFKLDMEHGIAVVFENNEFKAAGAQDIIL